MVFPPVGVVGFASVDGGAAVVAAAFAVEDVPDDFGTHATLNEHLIRNGGPVDQAGLPGVELVDEMHHVPRVRFSDPRNRLLGDQLGERVSGTLFV